MAKVNLSNLTNLENQTTAVSTINVNNSSITAAVEKTLSRDGSSPNQMLASLDMNSNRIINLPDGVDDQEPVTVSQLNIASGGSALASSFVTLGPDALLANERVLEVGTNLSLLDTGPNGTVTLNISDPELTALATTVSGADKLPYYTGVGTADVTNLTTFGRSIIDDPDATTARTTLGTVIGTDVQAYDADLAAVAGLATTGLIARTGSGTVSTRTVTGTANEISVSNGDGVSGNPTVSIPSAVTLIGKTLTGGTFASPAISGTASGTGTIPGTMLVNTAVTPGSYTNTNLTVDAQGRITAAATGSAAGTATTAMFETRAAAVAATIPTSVLAVQTLGYATTSDNGGARYKWVSSIAAGKLGFTSANGRNFEIIETSINVDMAGALGDNVTDDSVAIRAAIASVPLGGDLLFTAGKTYRVSQDGANPWCLLFPAPINVKGFGGHTYIVPLGTVANTVSTLYFKGATTTEDRFTEISHLFLGTAAGVRTGLHGIVLDTTAAGSYFRKLTIKNCFIVPGTGTNPRGIFCNNTAANNPNGGVYGCTFTDNCISGGIYFYQSGDSITVSNNIIYGVNPGIEVDLIANATGPYIRDNNITSTGGAVKINRAYGFVIDGGIFEMLSGAAGSNGAVVDINAGTSTVYMGVIKNVVFVPLGGTAITKFVRIRNSAHVKVEDNTFAGTGFTGVDIASSNGCVVGKQTVGTGNTYAVDDGTSQTVGVSMYVGQVGRPAFQNSWVNQGAPTTALRYYKDTAGYVHIEGHVMSGTLSSIVFTLPTGYRPGAFVASQAVGNVQVTASGDVYSIYSTNTSCNMSVVFLAADEGHTFI